MSFMEIFQPGLKYLREEQYRRQMDVAYPTNGGNPPIEIDLDAGTATIVVRVPAPEQVEVPADEPASSARRSRPLGWPTSAAPPQNPRAPWH